MGTLEEGDGEKMLGWLFGVVLRCFGLESLTQEAV